MIAGHFRRVREVKALSEQTVIRQVLFRSKLKRFSHDLHACFGSFKLVLGGFSAGFLFDRLRPHWRGIQSSSNTGLALLKLIPLAELYGQTISRQFFNRE
ncbi:MAG TPA: hypothetical protein VKY38_07440 [Azoarcus sp.]|nr:hypothetical protein [Azoarcus sp.]